MLDQLVWFLLSTRTTVENCEAAYAALRTLYPSWDGLASAREEDLYEPLRPAGLFRTRARNLLAAIAIVVKRFGSASLEDLREWSDEDCEAFLLSLPGAGLKVARCVMSFGLGRERFAVDAHIWRVSRRLGWHDFPGAAPSPRGADHLQSLVAGRAEPEQRRPAPRPERSPQGEAREDPLLSAAGIVSLHVNLIRLGREFCPADEPRCAGAPGSDPCPLSSICPTGRGDQNSIRDCAVRDSARSPEKIV